MSIYREQCGVQEMMAVWCVGEKVGRAALLFLCTSLSCTHTLYPIPFVVPFRPDRTVDSFLPHGYNSCRYLLTLSLAQHIRVYPGVADISWNFRAWSERICARGPLNCNHHQVWFFHAQHGKVWVKWPQTTIALNRLKKRPVNPETYIQCD
jgi:hypothetical protein